MRPCIAIPSHEYALCYSALLRLEIEAARIPAFPFRLISVKRGRRVRFSKALQQPALYTLIKHNGIRSSGAWTRCKKRALCIVARQSLWAWTREIIRAKKNVRWIYQNALWKGSIIRPRQRPADELIEEPLQGHQNDCDVKQHFKHLGKKLFQNYNLHRQKIHRL